MPTPARCACWGSDLEFCATVHVYRRPAASLDVTTGGQTRKIQDLTPVVAALLVGLLLPADAQRSEPFVPIGVWYEAGTLPPRTVLRDLQTIRALGFNHVKMLVRWAQTETVRGTFHFEPLDQFLTLADQAGLRVIIQPHAEPAPAWTAKPTGDASFIAAFVEGVTSRARAHRSFHAADAIGDPYRVSMYPRPRDGMPWTPVQLAWRLDAIRSAAGDKGWSLGELQAGPALKGSGTAYGVTGTDLRLWAWAAIARGARAITFASWSVESSPANSPYMGLAEADATTDRARMAGELAGTISRNAALFAPLRPRPSRVAVLYNSLWDVAPTPASAAAHAATSSFYRHLFEWNVQADIIHPDEIAIGKATNYRAIFAALPEMLPRGARDALDAYVRGGGTLLTDRSAEPSDLIMLRPDVRVDGGSGLVETRFLESADTLVLVGLNHADTPQTVKFTFSPDTPEAIWQNMETGGSVNFVQGPGELTYRHAFAPRDAMVLMIRTRLR
jgi:hypothetical protein